MSLALNEYIRPHSFKTMKAPEINENIYPTASCNVLTNVHNVLEN